MFFTRNPKAPNRLSPGMLSERVWTLVKTEYPINTTGVVSIYQRQINSFMVDVRGCKVC